MKLENIPETLKKSVQIGSIGSIMGLMILVFADKSEFGVVLFVGLIAMFTYSLLLSSLLLNIGAKRGGTIVLIGVTLLSMIYVGASIPIMMNLFQQETGISLAFGELWSYALYANYIFVMVCIISFVIEVLVDKKVEPIKKVEAVEPVV